MLRVVWVLVLGVAACAGGPPPYDDLMARPVHELERWRVQEGSQLLGWVALKEIRDPRAPVRYYHVENRFGQWVGYADEAGRFYRRVPFAMEEQFLGIYPMEEGLALMYQTEGPLTLSAARVEEASMTEARRRP